MGNTGSGGSDRGPVRVVHNAASFARPSVPRSRPEEPRNHAVQAGRQDEVSRERAGADSRESSGFVPRMVRTMLHQVVQSVRPAPGRCRWSLHAEMGKVCLNADLGRAVAGRGTAAGLSSELNAVGYGGLRRGDGSEGSGGLPDGDVAALDTGAVHSPTSGSQSLSLCRVSSRFFASDIRFQGCFLCVGQRGRRAPCAPIKNLRRIPAQRKTACPGAARPAELELVLSLSLRMGSFLSATVCLSLSCQVFCSGSGSTTMHGALGRPCFRRARQMVAVTTWFRGVALWPEHPTWRKWGGRVDR